MTTDLGVGVIGCGNVSDTYFGLANLFKGYQIVACADLNNQLAEAQAQEFNIESMSVDALLKRDDIEVIINLTVPKAHAEVSRQILNSGKHVYTEKPLALSIEEASQLHALASEKQLRVGCAPDTFFGGSHQLARQLVDNGEIGQVTSGTCHVLSHGMENWHPNPDFFFQPGAGPVLDIGPYYIANLINLIGPVKRVAALSSQAFDSRTIGNGDRLGETVAVTTPTNVHALLEFASGATITLGASWDVWKHKHNHMELYGTDGSLILPDPNFFHGDVLMAKPDGELVEQAPLEHPFNVLNQEEDDGPRANYRGAGLGDMCLAIQSGVEHRCSLERALHAVDVMVSILRSGEIGEFVDVKTTCTRPAALNADEAKALMQ